MKRIISFICVFALALSMMVMPANTQAAATKSVYFTVEKLTIGQGLFVQPTKVEIKDGDTVKTAFENLMKQTNNEAIVDNTYGFYLSGIKKADTGKINIPKEISAMPDYDTGYMGKVKAPSNDNNDGNANAPDLSAGAYNSMSGWMFMVNNKGMAEGADSVVANDGDVIRLQFSVFGWGDDIGTGFTDANLKLANKDALIKKIAEAKNDKEAMSIAAAKKAVEDGIKVLENYNATDAEISLVTETLDKYLTKTEITVPQAKIKSIKNIKTRRAKITVKKIKEATGYVYKYSKNKSLKKATKKTTKATSIKTKKFKKKQTCYAKVKAYKEVNGVKHFGKWSKLKKAKIRK